MKKKKELCVSTHIFLIFCFVLEKKLKKSLQITFEEAILYTIVFFVEKIREIDGGVIDR